MSKFVALIRKIFGYIVLMSKGGVRYARWLGVSVGDGCRIYSTNFGSEPFMITIGDRVTITSGVKFITHDGSAWLMRDNKGRRFVYNPIKIENDVFIGVNSIIMPGVRLGNRVIVAAGSIVTKSIPDGSIVAGIPAKYIGSYSSYETFAINNFVSEIELNNIANYVEKTSKGIDPRGFKPYIKIPDQNN